jgi:hypothetical protein
MAAMTSLHRTATHEAGHAVAAHLLRLPVRHVLVSDGRGEVAYYPVPVGSASIARRAVVSLGGPAAELEGTATAMPPANDADQGAIGTGSAWTGPPAKLDRYRRGAAALRERAAVDAVAAALLQRGRLTGFDVADIVGPRWRFQLVA